ncbi:MAG: M23 family metallopeptidase, partial [Gemmatimonadales bacterium]
DGVVLHAGWAGAYGRLVEIQHPNGVITRYGHLRGVAPNLRAGNRVIEGQCIGFVGATGLATGPHLHFEFRLNGAATDPSLLDGDPGAPISDQDRPVFQQMLSHLRRLLPVLPIVLASGH